MSETIPVKVKQEDGSTKEFNICIKNPSNEVISMAERHRAKVFNQCLMDGIMTRPELEKMMNERGLWSKDKDAKHDELTSKIVNLEKDLYVGDGKKADRKLDQGKDIAIQIRRLRIELRDLITQKVSLEENTAESLADNAKFDFLVASCTYHENGEKVYKNISEYNDKSADAVSFSAAAKLAEMMYSIDPGFEKNLPENRWLRDHKLVNEKGELVNENGELIDTEGRRINEKGQYINDDGQWIDKEGNLLGEDGTYIPTVNYTTGKTTKKTTRSRKRTAKSDSES